MRLRFLTEIDTSGEDFFSIELDSGNSPYTGVATLLREVGLVIGSHVKSITGSSNQRGQVQPLAFPIVADM